MKYWLLIVTPLLLLSIGCNNAKKTTQPEEQFLKDKILVLIKDGFTAMKLEAVFEDYGLKSEGQISRTENRYMITYDMSRVKPEEMLEKLRNARIVLEAEFAPVSKMNN